MYLKTKNIFYELIKTQENLQKIEHDEEMKIFEMIMILGKIELIILVFEKKMN